MLRADPRAWLSRLRHRFQTWWRPATGRLRLRRQLMLWSLPVAVALLALATLLTTALITGHRIVGDYHRHDTAALRDDLDRLRAFNVIEPHKLRFAEGDLAVLEGRLDDAEALFTATVAEDDSCPARINLELVRETQGDLAAASGDPAKAEERYTSALAAVRGAGPNCFAGNDDPDPDRRHIRQDAEPRLLAKIDSLHNRPAPPPPSAPPSAEVPQAPADSSAPLTPTTVPGPSAGGSGAPVTTAPTPAPSNSGPDSRPVFGSGGEDTVGGGKESLNNVDPDRLPTAGGQPLPGHRLGTGGSGDPLEVLRDALGNSDATGGSRE